MLKAILISVAIFFIALLLEASIGISWNMAGIGTLFAVVSNRRLPAVRHREETVAAVPAAGFAASAPGDLWQRATDRRGTGIRRAITPADG